MTTQGFVRNEKCFVRKNHDCGRYFGASKTCFIACPDSEEIGLELEVITQKLQAEGVEPFIAARERVYGEDIFCTKICGKIIESQFCIIVLNDVKNGHKDSIPNPNVYYEYGMMTSMNKEVIPLLKNGQKPVFNIQSFDIVQYTSTDLAKEIENAIKKTIAIISDRRIRQPDSQVSSSLTKRIGWLIELIGLDEAHKYIEGEWRIACKDTNFRVYMDEKYNLFFLGVFISISEPLEINGNVKVLLKRLDNISRRYDVAIQRLEKEYEEVLKKETKRKTEFVATPSSLSGLAGLRLNSALVSASPFDETSDSIKRQLDIPKWNRRALDRIVFIVATPFHKTDKAGFTNVFTDLNLSFKLPTLEIWDDSQIEKLLKDKGLSNK